VEAFAKVSAAGGQPQTNWSARLTVQYVMDVINHVAAVHVQAPLVDARESSQTLKRFLVWEQTHPVDQVESGHCSFAAFVAFELARGGLGQNQPIHLRVCIAVDFISHVLLETT